MSPIPPPTDAPTITAVLSELEVVVLAAADVVTELWTTVVTTDGPSLPVVVDVVLTSADVVTMVCDVETVLCEVVCVVVTAVVAPLEHVVENTVDRGDTVVVVTVIVMGTWTVVAPPPTIRFVSVKANVTWMCMSLRDAPIELTLVTVVQLGATVSFPEVCGAPHDVDT